MAKNMQFNIEARKKMKSMLLAKMSVNAKKAKDDLADAMRKTQAQFAAAAALENKRWKKNTKRFKKTREKGMADMATEFYSEIEKIKEQAKKDRAHAENSLAS